MSQGRILKIENVSYKALGQHEVGHRIVTTNKTIEIIARNSSDHPFFYLKKDFDTKDIIGVDLLQIKVFNYEVVLVCPGRVFNFYGVGSLNSVVNIDVCSKSNVELKQGRRK